MRWPHVRVFHESRRQKALVTGDTWQADLGSGWEGAHTSQTHLGFQPRVIHFPTVWPGASVGLSDLICKMGIMMRRSFTGVLGGFDEITQDTSFSNA